MRIAVGQSADVETPPPPNEHNFERLASLRQLVRPHPHPLAKLRKYVESRGEIADFSFDRIHPRE